MEDREKQNEGAFITFIWILCSTIQGLISNKDNDAPISLFSWLGIYVMGTFASALVLGSILYYSIKFVHYKIDRLDKATYSLSSKSGLKLGFNFHLRIFIIIAIWFIASYTRTFFG